MSRPNAHIDEKARYALYYDDAPTAFFASSYGARLFAQGMINNGWMTDSSKVRILDQYLNKWVLIEHLLEPKRA